MTFFDYYKERRAACQAPRRKFTNCSNTRRDPHRGRAAHALLRKCHVDAPVLGHDPQVHAVPLQQFGQAVLAVCGRALHAVIAKASRQRSAYVAVARLKLDAPRRLHATEGDAVVFRPSRQRIRLFNGQVEYAYRYTISNAYKARLSRAPYYDGTLQPRSW